MMFTQEPPPSGQFVRVWEHKGQPWCATYRWGDDHLQIYNIETDEWERTTLTELRVGNNPHFITT